MGKLLFNDNCASCHGQDAVAGANPDLRYASKAVHQRFEAIVLDGARSSAGMPSFKKILNAGQVRAIQAYVLSRAAEGAKQAQKL
jgi:quinohemoprotein ethanol dehydrogenase